MFLQTSNSNAYADLRRSVLAARFSPTASTTVIPKSRCGGLKAVQDISAQIRNGSIEVGLAVAAECFSQNCGVVSEGAPKDDNEGGATALTQEMLAEYAEHFKQHSERAKKSVWIGEDFLPLPTIIPEPETNCNCNTGIPSSNRSPNKSSKSENVDLDGGTGSSHFSSQCANPIFLAVALLLMTRHHAHTLSLSTRSKFFAAAFSPIPSHFPQHTHDSGPCLAVVHTLSKCSIDPASISTVVIEEPDPSTVRCLKEFGIDGCKIKAKGGSNAFANMGAMQGLVQAISALSGERIEEVAIVLTSLGADDRRGMCGVWVREFVFD